MKRLLHVGVFSFIICLVFAFSWPSPGSASNLSNEESTSVLPDVPSLSLLLLQEEKIPPPPSAANPNNDGKKAENPNNASKKAANNASKKPAQEENPNKAGGGNQKDGAGDSIVPTALIIALIGVVGAAGLWFVPRSRSA